MKPLCFVLMPFGQKPTGSGRSIDFDAVYHQLIRPAIEQAGMEPIRADEEAAGGIVHKPMFERLLLCEFAVADLTTANANVFYELGVRHAVRPHTTVLVFAEGERLPFDVAPDRGVPYRLGSDGPADVGDRFVAQVAAGLRAALEPMTDSPIYQLLDDWPTVSQERADAFRQRVEENHKVRAELARARDLSSAESTLAAVREVESRLVVRTEDKSVQIDLMLSYRAASAWEDVVRVVDAMSTDVASRTTVREQLGMALNRCGRRAEAAAVLTDLVDRHGASPETCGILGRVFKDQYQDARNASRSLEAAGFRQRAIDAYLRGFEADWRYYYPGINAVELIYEADPGDPRLARLVPVVEYAVDRMIESGRADYWAHATRAELAVLKDDRAAAEQAFGAALATGPDPWMRETTADTLHALGSRRNERWVVELERSLRGADDGR
jgi:tetratricopeptide (TPR) repeat protein